MDHFGMIPFTKHHSREGWQVKYHETTLPTSTTTNSRTRSQATPVFLQQQDLSAKRRNVSGFPGPNEGMADHMAKLRDPDKLCLACFWCMSVACKKKSSQAGHAFPSSH